MYNYILYVLYAVGKGFSCIYPEQVRVLVYKLNVVGESSVVYT
jgi:hypothetical protein